ncbi:spermidine synthase [Terrabacter sp. Soil811]|uniref:spermidine synthase n=1 Tax=Terrabacter sp. Soil811 TaxID=1736419 RepID=UPI0009EA8310|nr:spermidine synthase [Terrabacter sp. Soil811]
MSRRFEEIDWQQTPMGEISLRRRLEPSLLVDVYEVKLGEEFLMSSLFTVAEVELARLGLAAVGEGGGDDESLDVVVGGLGLGYTAVAALEDARVRSLTVVEALGPVISWHERQLLPDTASLTVDPRTTLLEGDFFALARQGQGFGDAPALLHAVLLDVDHTPHHVLHPSHADLYTRDGLSRLAATLHPGGVFALWSDDPPEDAFTALLAEVFADVAAHEVSFANPLTGGTSSNSVYVATTAVERQTTG